jgi:Zn-dependent peptidase ImmA (M78 family)
MLPIRKQENEEMAVVPVNGKVLQWARQIRGLSLNDAAMILGVSSTELRSYESGGKKPLVGFLRKMSQRYRINFSSLLMPEPLPIEKLPTDRRVRRGRTPLSIDTLVAIEEITEALDTFQDIREGGSRIVPALHIGKAKLKEDPETVAARERKSFGVSIEEQKTWRGLGEARRKWRQRIEDHGVFTYMIPLPPQELSGFSLFRDGMAAICVNDREPTEGAKIFTFFHEYCHLLLRKAGISDENNKDSLEKFCNAFAASFLIPRDALVSEIGDVQTPYDFPDSEIKRLSTRFRVSNRAMAMRLQETGLAPEGFYLRRTAPWDIPAESRPMASESSPSPIRIRIKRIGKLHAKTVMRAVKKHAINSFDASQLIGLQPTVLPKVAAALE